MSKVSLIFQVLISIPKTLYFNFKVFKFKMAIKLPVYVNYNVEIMQIYKGAIKINTSKITPFMVKIGIGGSNAIKDSRGKIFLNKLNNGKVVFSGNAKFSNGIVIYVNKGIIEFGINFSCNKNCFISSDYKVKFGNEVLLGWNVNIRDSDGHEIIYLNENEKKKEKDVEIGNHVWICSNVDILKNSKIGNDCIVGYKSLVTNIMVDNNKLIAGIPAKIIKNNVNWEK